MRFLFILTLIPSFFLRLYKEEKRKNVGMIVCTVATHSDRYFPSLLHSCQRHGCNLKVLGWGQKWQGFAWRWQLVRDFLASQPDTQVVMFIDPFDVIVLRDSRVILKTFENMQVP